MTTLLEREDLLAHLSAQWAQACAGPGRIVLVEGEAGIGKTSLLRALARSLQAGGARVAWGACEALLTPRALGALDDIAQQCGGALWQAVASGAERHRLFVAFIDLLAEQPTLAVIEDVHWADEATLDLLRYAGRRIARTRSMLVASFRNDELVPSHPLRAVLGDLATGGALRLAPAPLSLDAVRRLSAGLEIDVAELHRKTGGNPFFVTEVLASRAPGVPATVQDAVHARAARLAPSARAVLDAAAVAGPRVEAWLLRELTAAESEAIDECLATGVMRADAGAFEFRHELARQAVIAAMTPTRAMSLHRMVLQALQSHGTASAARLVLHAGAAGDGDAVRRWAPVAAREAATRGAHRQAAAHWAAAIEHAVSAPERAALQDEYSVELQTSGSLDESIAALGDAARLWREQGHPERAAVSLARLALHYTLAARNADAHATMRDARALVADSGGTTAAFVVQRCAAGLHMLDNDGAEAIALAAPALADAERRQDEEEIIEGHLVIGLARFGIDDADAGTLHLERALALAERTGRDRAVARVLANLGSACTVALRLDRAESALRRGTQFCADRDLDAPRLYQVAWLAQVALLRGRWDEAAAAAQEVIGDRRATTIARIMALIALGRLHARRGDAGVWTVLDEARELAERAGAIQRLAPMHAARAEAAWLEGRSEDAVREAAACLPLARTKRHAGYVAELSAWMRRGGAEPSILVECAEHPCALEAAGRWQDAAHAWRALACPYETARALADGDEAAQRQALALLAPLGARPLIEHLRRRLRAAGVRGLPLGPRASTEAHPSGLTSKEIAVLALLASGLRNKEIALRMNRSTRTIDHHLQAIFAKLGVATRAQAVSVALRLGVATPDLQRRPT
jgi:DNA-binding CsgD family transcriptional regulator